MKLWRFYYKPTEEELEDSERISTSDKYPLYAFSHDKKIVDKFMSERNLDRFIVKKSSVDREDLENFSKKYRGKALIKYQMGTVLKKYTKDEKSFSIEYAITVDEKLIIEEIYEGNGPKSLGDITWWYNLAPPPEIFKKEIVEALRYLDYNMIYKIYNKVSFSGGVEEMYEDDDYSAPDWTYDDFAYFINLFGNTLKFK